MMSAVIPLPTALATPVRVLGLEESRPERILVVDDDSDIRNLLVRLLRSGGYDVSDAPDGHEALRRLTEAPVHALPDLLLMDVTMPGMDGVATCVALQALGLGSHTPPVIFLSALGAPQERVDGLEAGAVDYIVKPFVPEEVRARVRAALRGKAMRDALAFQAATDPLTGLANRRQLDQRLGEAFALARRHNRPLACLMVDVDHFKRVNDTHGHGAGDSVLIEVAARLRAQCRAVDTAARYGGEEFTVLLPETGSPGALILAERIRAAVANEPFSIALPGSGVEPHAAEPNCIQIRISIGVAVLTPEMASPEALTAAADTALYAAKQGGRDRVVLAAGCDAVSVP